MGLNPDDDVVTDEGEVLSPDELDIAKDENVVPLEDGRYVIASDADGMDRANAAAEQASKSSLDDETNVELDAKTVREWQEKELASVGSQYGFRITALTENAVSHQQMYSDDVGTVFDSLLMWYAQQLDRDTPVEDVLGILLTESNVRIRFPRRCFTQLLDAHGLDPDDSIADLYQAACSDDGMIFPPDRTMSSFNQSKDE